MGNAIETLLRRDDVQAARPAPAARIKAVAGRFKGGELPAALRTLWKASDGVQLEAMNAHILGPTEVLEVLDAWSPGYTRRGFVPLLDDHQSNGCWMDLEGFFHRRHVPDAMARTIAWFEDLIADRNPHHRAGHLMCDE